MTILWCGGEEIDFPSGDSLIVSGASYTRNSGQYAREALRSVGTSLSKTFPPVTSFWLHFYSNYGGVSTFKPLAGLVDLSTRKGLFVGTGTVNNKLRVTKFDGTTHTELVAEVGASFSANSLFDLQVTDYGTTSNIKLYLNGTLIIDFNGDSSISGLTAFNCTALIGYLTGGTNHVLSELIVADEDTRLLSLKTLAPNASGDASEWTNGYGSIDEVTVSDADTIFTDLVDQSFQCNLTGMPEGDFICKAVKMTARATDGIGGIGIQMGIKTNSTVDLGASVTLGGSWETVEALYNQNPVTSNRFTPAEIEALQFAVKSVTV